MKKLTDELIGTYKAAYLAEKEKQKLAERLRTENIGDAAFDKEKASLQEFSFSVDLPTMKAVSQGNTGRCWMLAGLNLLREIAVQKMDRAALPNGIFEFSPAYLSFWDKLEKSNWFLETVIQDRDRPYDDRKVHSCFQFGVIDGGFWVYFTDLVRKYGLVPKEVMPETAQSANTETLNDCLNYFLRKVGADIRNAGTVGEDPARLYEMKDRAMKKVFSFLCQCYSCPPDTFSYSYAAKSGERKIAVYTPQAFCKELAGDILDHLVDTVSLPYEKLLFGEPCVLNDVFQVLGGQEERFFNLPFEEMKALCVEQLKDGLPVVCTADDDKMCREELQLWDDGCFDYEKTIGFSFDMSRKDYYQLKAGSAAHSLMITGVNIGKSGKPDRWKLENTYDIDGLHQGYFTCSDSWFDRYMVCAVLDRKYLRKYESALDNRPNGFEIWEI